jgi:hypothetical protein
VVIGSEVGRSVEKGPIETLGVTVTDGMAGALGSLGLGTNGPGFSVIFMPTSWPGTPVGTFMEMETLFPLAESPDREVLPPIEMPGIGVPPLCPTLIEPSGPTVIDIPLGTVTVTSPVVWFEETFVPFKKLPTGFCILYSELLISITWKLASTS